MNIRHVNFAGQSLFIEYPPEITDLIEFLYRDTNSDVVESASVKLSITLDEGELALQHKEEQLYRGTDEAVLATTLIRQTIHHLIDNNCDGMALHAAALSKNGKGIVLPGRSGSGKTTLSTWLAARGFNYLTDEFVFIEENTDTIQAFTRPPNVKVRGFDALNSYFDREKHADQTVQSKHVAMIPPHLLNPLNTLETACVSLIVFPKFKRGSALKLERLTKAKAGLALMESLVNARNLNGHGFNEAARLARTVPGYSLEYGSFDQLQKDFDEILPG